MIAMLNRTEFVLSRECDYILIWRSKYRRISAWLVAVGVGCGICCTVNVQWLRGEKHKLKEL